MANGWGRRVREQLTRFATGRTTSYTAPTRVALTTANPGDDGQVNAAGAVEPTAAGGYVRQAITWADPTIFSSVTNDTASLSKHSTFNYGASSAAWSTGSSVLTNAALYDSSGLFTEAAYFGRGAISTPPAVASAGITVTVAADAIQMGLIST